MTHATDTDPENETFTWSMLIQKGRAELDADGLSVRLGLARKRIPLGRVHAVYLDHKPASNMHELIVGHGANPNQLKVARFPGNEHAPGLLALTEALVARRPGTDLRHLPKAEALAAIGARDTGKIALVAFPLVLLAVMGVFLSPALVHGFDRGAETVAVSGFEADAVTSRNLVLTDGILHMDRAIRKRVTGRDVNQVSLYIPVVHAGWTPGDPVPVVAETGELTLPEAQALAGRTDLDGVLRNVLFEGLDKDVARAFAGEFDLVVTRGTPLVELGANPVLERNIAFAVLGVTALVVGLGTWFMGRRRRTA